MTNTFAPSVSHLGVAASKNSFDTLQAGRALAAIFVVFFHAHVFFIPERLYPGLSISRAFNMGYAGVEFFFVLSGFIMILVHRRDIGVPERAGRFMTKRVLRILPFYWVVTLLLVALLVLQGGASGDRLSLERFLFSMALVPMPDGSPLLIGAAWTLSHEFLFYALFCIMLIAPKPGMAIFAIWFAIICALLLDRPLSYGWDFFFAPYNLLFGMGMIAALYFRRLPRGLAVPASVLGIAAFLATGLADAYDAVDMSHATRTISFGIAAALAILGLTALEVAAPLRVPRSLVFLGDASFAIYLVHGTALPIATKALVAIGLASMVPPIICLLVLVGLSVVAGSLAHIYLEKPLIAVLRRRLGV